MEEAEGFHPKASRKGIGAKGVDFGGRRTGQGFPWNITRVPDPANRHDEMVDKATRNHHRRGSE